MSENLKCIPPPKLSWKNEWPIQKSIREEYELCKNDIAPDLKERQKLVADLRTLLQKNTLTGYTPLSVVIPGKKLDEVIITNGVDSLFLELWDGKSSPHIVLTGITNIVNWISLHQTFNVETIDEVVRVSQTTLRLLEMKRSPKKFGFSSVDFSLDTKKNILIHDTLWSGVKKSTLAPLIFQIKPIEFREEVVDFIKNLFEENKPIPKIPHIPTIYPERTVVV